MSGAAPLKPRAVRPGAWFPVLRGLALGCLAVGAFGGVAAEPGVSAQKITFGMSAPRTGGLAHYGAELERGIRMAFAQANAAGGLAGRQIELLAKDDAGRPQLAAANTQSLLDAGVLALTGYHGSASIEAMLSMAERAGAPVLGVASSAEFLREPTRRLVFNFRAGAREEAAAMVTQLDAVGLTEVAVIVQEDALGRAGLEGMKVELARLALRPSASVRLAAEAGAPAVAQAVEAACKSRPQALALVLDARNALAAIQYARKIGCVAQFYVMSEAGAQLQAGMASRSDLSGVVVSQVVPHPFTGSTAAVAEYMRLSGQAGTAPTYPGLEGFIYGRIISEALRRCQREPSRRCLVEALESRPVDVGGYRVQFSADDHRGSRLVEMTIVTPEGRFRR